jgi:hypothetical protein
LLNFKIIDFLGNEICVYFGRREYLSRGKALIETKLVEYDLKEEKKTDNKESTLTSSGAIDPSIHLSPPKNS